jgi:uncharacterized protein
MPAHGVAPGRGIAHIQAMSDRAEMPRASSCPICGKPAAESLRPFCSRRCANVDLNRWLSGVYAVPVKEEEDEDGTAGRKGADPP